MKNALFVTDFSNSSEKAFRNVYQLSKELSFDLKIVKFQPDEDLEILFTAKEIQDDIEQFVGKALRYSPETLPIGMGLKGNLRELSEEMGLFFDLIIIPKCIKSDFLEHCIIAKEELNLRCPILFVPDLQESLSISKVMYLGAEFGDLNWSVQRQLRNFCRRSKASLQFAKPLKNKSWFFNKTPFHKSKFLVELGWFRDLFFKNLKKYFENEKVDVLILSSTGITNFWLNRKALTSQVKKFKKPILLLPQKVYNKSIKTNLSKAA